MGESRTPAVAILAQAICDSSQNLHPAEFIQPVRSSVVGTMAEGDVAKYVAEFVGTFLLVFTVGCNVLSGSPVWAATSIACVLMVSIYALGGVSGANFNPAVSVTLGLSGKLDWKDVGIYSVVQIVAGICAGLSYGALFFKVFNLAPGAGFGWWEALLAEVLYTFMLCFVVLNVATASKNAGNQFFGLAIGFVIVAGGYAAGNISGGAFNPAVALGIDISSKGLGYYGWMYTLLSSSVQHWQQVTSGLSGLGYYGWMY